MIYLGKGTFYVRLKLVLDMVKLRQCRWKESVLFVKRYEYERAGSLIWLEGDCQCSSALRLHKENECTWYDMV